MVKNKWKAPKVLYIGDGSFEQNYFYFTNDYTVENLADDIGLDIDDEIYYEYKLVGPKKVVRTMELVDAK